MCGICGEVRFDSQSPRPEIIHNMMNALARRGPEAAGLLLHDGMALGHRRLKIIDLSEKAQQPMTDSSLGLDIVFNGAIYNYRELRSELETAGYRFFSHGDTEVLLKAYHAWGSDMLPRLNGMFAFAIWNRRRQDLFLARDRCGIKPLYVSNIPGGMRFASSLTALLQTPDIGADIDPVALHHFMTLHAVVPPPRTILKGVQKVPPACYVRVDKHGKVREERYWQASYLPDHRLSFQERRKKLLNLLTAAVKRRLVADVPVGVLLSGGIDSSLLVSLLAETGLEKIKTYSIGFENVEGEDGNEFYYSDLVARHFATDHTKIIVGSDKLLDSLENCVRSMSEPMVSHDNIGFYLLSEEISNHVKVVQSGQGADEIFGGYMWYPPLMEGDQGIEGYKKVFFDLNHQEFRQAVQSQYAGEDHSGLFAARHFELPEAQHTIDKALRLDTTVMLVDDPVKRVDNMTMAWGLEARVPFLDHEVVEFAAQTPAAWKIADGEEKYILKEAARSLLPAEIIDRPKRPFPVPALKYIKGPYLELVRDLLLSKTCRERNIFRADYINRLLDRPLEYLTPLKMSKLWQTAMLEYWFQLQVD